MDDSMRDLVDLPDLENILPDIACAISRCYLPQRVAFLDLHRSIFLGLIRNGSGAYYHGNKGKKDESRCEEQKESSFVGQPVSLTHTITPMEHMFILYILTNSCSIVNTKSNICLTIIFVLYIINLNRAYCLCLP